MASHFFAPVAEWRGRDFADRFAAAVCGLVRQSQDGRRWVGLLPQTDQNWLPQRDPMTNEILYVRIGDKSSAKSQKAALHAVDTLLGDL